MLSFTKQAMKLTSLNVRRELGEVVWVEVAVTPAERASAINAQHPALTEDERFLLEQLRKSPWPMLNANDEAALERIEMKVRTP